MRRDRTNFPDDRPAIPSTTYCINCVTAAAHQCPLPPDAPAIRPAHCTLDYYTARRGRSYVSTVFPRNAASFQFAFRRQCTLTRIRSFSLPVAHTVAIGRLVGSHPSVTPKSKDKNKKYKKKNVE